MFMSKVIKFPKKEKHPAEDYHTKLLADEIDTLVFGTLDRLNIPMVGVVLADRIGELLNLAGKNGFDQQELKEIYMEIIDKKTKR